jgi:hypothetical protein
MKDRQKDPRTKSRQMMKELVLKYGRPGDPVTFIPSDDSYAWGGVIVAIFDGKVSVQREFVTGRRTKRVYVIDAESLWAFMPYPDDRSGDGIFAAIMAQMDQQHSEIGAA